MIRDGGGWRRRVLGRGDRASSPSGCERDRRAHGPDSVGVLGSARATNEDNYVAQKFARVVLGTNNVDCCARVCHAPSAAALKRDARRRRGDQLLRRHRARAHDPRLRRQRDREPPDRRRAHQAGGAARRAPHRHRSAAHRARRGRRRPSRHPARHERPAAQRDGPRHRRRGPGRRPRFIADRVDGLRGVRAVQSRAWTPERAAAICGVEAAAISGVRRGSTRRAAPAMSLHGLGLTEHVQGTDGVMALVNLALLTGNIGQARRRRESAARPEQRAGRGAHGLRAGHADRDRPPIDRDARAFERVWGAPLPAHAGPAHAGDDGRGRSPAGSRRSGRSATTCCLTNPKRRRDAPGARGARAARSCRTVPDRDGARVRHGVPAGLLVVREGRHVHERRAAHPARPGGGAAGRAGHGPTGRFSRMSRRRWAARGFAFSGPEEIWDEVRAVARRPRHDLRPARDGRAAVAVPDARTTRGRCVCTRPLVPRFTLRPHRVPADAGAADGGYPFLLTTGRTLYQFNAGTMTMRTPERDAPRQRRARRRRRRCARPGHADGDRVRVVSAYGAACCPRECLGAVRPGQLFATFHTADVFLNRVTGPHRDGRVATSEER